MMKNLIGIESFKKQVTGFGMLAILFLLTSAKVVAQANFSLSPSTATVSVDQTFTMEVKVDLNQSTNTELDVAEAYVNFDPAYLQVVSMTGGGPFNLVAVNQFNNTAGTVDYAAGTTTPPVTQDFTLLTITFKAISTPPSGSTALTFNTALPRQTNAFRIGESVLGTTTGAVVNIVALGALPVGLTNFTGKAQDKKVVLSWTTAFETNNRGFEIQRSVDGTAWTAIGSVKGNGNRTNVQEYSYVDNNLAPRRYYYRLKQEDFGTQFKFSSVIAVTVLGNQLFVLEQNQPNPYSSNTTISFSLAEKNKVKLTVVDLQGRLVRTLLDETRPAGTHVINFGAQSMGKGIYYYKLETGGLSDTKKMLIQ